MRTLRIDNSQAEPDREAVQAQVQWERDGTMPSSYVKHVLGDISKPVTVSPPPAEDRQRR